MKVSKTEECRKSATPCRQFSPWTTKTFVKFEDSPKPPAWVTEAHTFPAGLSQFRRHKSIAILQSLVARSASQKMNILSAIWRLTEDPGLSRGNPYFPLRPKSRRLSKNQTKRQFRRHTNIAILPSLVARLPRRKNAHPWCSRDNFFGMNCLSREESFAFYLKGLSIFAWRRHHVSYFFGIILTNSVNFAFEVCFNTATLSLVDKQPIGAPLTTSEPIMQKSSKILPEK